MTKTGIYGRIYNYHERGVRMFYDINQAIDACDDEPSLVFEAIKNNYRDVYEMVLEKENFDFNLTDENNNNILMRLLKNKDYDLVSKYVSNPSLSINHQNNDGNTLMHLLVTYNYIDVREIFEKILEREDFLPNIKNNNNESILDKSINNEYLYLSIKILSDKRFNSIGLYSFKNLYETFIKSSNYGKYSRLNNYTLIFDNLKKKRLMPSMMKLLRVLKKEEKNIIEGLEEDNLDNLDMIINHAIEETI